jgi:hypothetical protein
METQPDLSMNRTTVADGAGRDRNARRWLIKSVLAFTVTASVAFAAPHWFLPTPTYPQWRDQTAHEAAMIAAILGHPLQVSFDPSSPPVLYVPARHAQAKVAGNHKSTPPQKPLTPGEAIGVLLYPTWNDQ